MSYESNDVPPPPLVHGDADTVAEFDQALALRDDPARAAAPFEFVPVPSMGRDFSLLRGDEIMAFLDRYLKR